MVGDGSYLMMNSELATSVMLGVKLIVVLLDNRGFGCIHRLPGGGGGRALQQPPRRHEPRGTAARRLRGARPRAGRGRGEGRFHRGAGAGHRAGAGLRPLLLHRDRHRSGRGHGGGRPLVGTCRCPRSPSAGRCGPRARATRRRSSGSARGAEGFGLFRPWDRHVSRQRAGDWEAIATAASGPGLPMTAGRGPDALLDRVRGPGERELRRAFGTWVRRVLPAHRLPGVVPEREADPEEIRTMPDARGAGTEADTAVVRGRPPWIPDHQAGAPT